MRENVLGWFSDGICVNYYVLSNVSYRKLKTLRANVVDHHQVPRLYRQVSRRPSKLKPGQGRQVRTQVKNGYGNIVGAPQAFAIRGINAIVADEA